MDLFILGVGIALYSICRAISYTSDSQLWKYVTLAPLSVILGSLVLQLYTGFGAYAILLASVLSYVSIEYVTTKYLIPEYKKGNKLLATLGITIMFLLLATPLFFTSGKTQELNVLNKLESEYAELIKDYDNMRDSTTILIEEAGHKIDSLQDKLEDVDTAIETVKEARDSLENEGDWRDIIDDFING